ncbi:Transposase [Marinospirillum alkaliphilum DSM 21637]|uniref:Transposase n=2 Tax=Marinospirillum TaxID=64968 RepID=A0A1K2A743_9GAMM|nr:Transposase [Marinospirillum alkaliphilum DSM 21637]
MRKIKEVLRLKWDKHLSNRQIASACGISRPTVSEYLRRFSETGLSWPLPTDLDESRLEQKLFPPAPDLPAQDRGLPDWQQIHQELKFPKTTLFLLWQEYRAANPEGYQYSWFCDHYRAWQGKLDLVMRQNHRAGEKLFVDYAGQTAPVIDPATGEIRAAQIFVAVMGASNYTFAEATWSQKLPDWISSHIRAFEFLGGVPELVVPDNLKSSVTKAHRYEPDLNPTYQDMAAHYGVSIVPARVRKPRDKAKAEGGVLIVERWILAALRHRQHFSLGQLNASIRELLTLLNQRPFRKLPGNRQEHFETIDRPALQPLPAEPYTYAEWKKARVHMDYHVAFDGHYYSVPCSLVKKEVELRVTEYTLEVFYQGQRVASHHRSTHKGSHTTVTAHMPEAHRQAGEWSPERLVRWATKVGPATSQLIIKALENRKHPQQAYRACLGILRLGKAYSEERLESACQRALMLGSCRYKSIESILKNRLDERPLEIQEELALPEQHDNIRGPAYYH